jgi:hypothetical protein
LTLPFRAFVSWCRDQTYCLEMTTFASREKCPTQDIGLALSPRKRKR